MRNESWKTLICMIVALALAVGVSAAGAADEAENEAKPSAEPPAEMVDVKDMMARAMALTKPGRHHALLERFIGTWKTSTRITMPGADAPAETGTSEFSWMMDGRWLQERGSGTFLGSPHETFSIFGYDNFKKSYVWTGVTTMDTAMLRAEGDLDPGGDVMILYGTLDEYLTGEHDKMVKYVWRFASDDEMTLEVHDLPIGERNTKVVQVDYRRAGGADVEAER